MRTNSLLVGAYGLGSSERKRFKGAPNGFNPKLWSEESGRTPQVLFDASQYWSEGSTPSTLAGLHGGLDLWWKMIQRVMPEMMDPLKQFIRHRSSLPADNCGGLMPVYAPAPPRKSSYREVVLNAVEQGRCTPTPLTKVGFAIQPSWRFMGSYKWGYK